MHGMRPTSIPNPELTWEVSKKFDIGFDLSFLQRIHLTFDFYNEEDRKSTRLNSSHIQKSRMPSSA